MKLRDLIKEQNIDGKNPGADPFQKLYDKQNPNDPKAIPGKQFPDNAAKKRMGQDAASLGKGSGGRITKVQKLKMSDIQDEVTINQKVGSCSQPNNVDKCLDDVTISWGNESHIVSFEYDGTIDDYGIDKGVDAEFMADSDDGRWQFILEVQGANGIEDGDCNPCIQGYDWDELIIQDHPENEDHLDPEDRFDQDPGYDDDPRFDDAIRSDFDDPRMEEGSRMLQERFQKLAGLKPLYELEGSFDARMQAAGGFSDEEMGDITSRDIGSSFPGTDNVSPFTAKAKDYTEKFKQEYREMSDDGIDEFNKEIIEYLLNAFPSAQATAKVFFAKKGI